MSTTLPVVTVQSSNDFHDDVTDSIEALDWDDAVNSPPTLSVTSYGELMETLTPRVLDLIETIRQGNPASINETARDVKNVHEELGRLAQLGITVFKQDGQRKLPVVWFDDLVVALPFEPEGDDTAAATP